jgi:methanogenic corrinoid protein MtbC1
VLVIGCITGELHTLGCRLVADHFERQGWTVHYLGADVPITAFVTLAQDVNADLIAVSATMPEQVAGVAALIQAVKGHRDQIQPVLVGGRPFQDDPELASSVGAWMQAATAAEAVRRATTRLSAVSVRAGLSCEGCIPVGEAAESDGERRLE